MAAAQPKLTYLTCLTRTLYAFRCSADRGDSRFPPPLPPLLRKDCWLASLGPRLVSPLQHALVCHCMRTLSHTSVLLNINFQQEENGRELFAQDCTIALSAARETGAEQKLPDQHKIIWSFFRRKSCHLCLLSIVRVLISYESHLVTNLQRCPLSLDMSTQYMESGDPVGQDQGVAATDLYCRSVVAAAEHLRISIAS